MRPIWGPFDWDLFSLTALFLGALAAHAFAETHDVAAWRHGVVWLAGTGLCLVGIPFVVNGWGNVRPAGPFVEGRFGWELMDPASAAARWLEPWL